MRWLEGQGARRFALAASERFLTGVRRTAASKKRVPVNFPQVFMLNLIWRSGVSPKAFYQLLRVSSKLRLKRAVVAGKCGRGRQQVRKDGNPPFLVPWRMLC